MNSKKSKESPCGNSGFTLIEVLISAALVSIAVLAASTAYTYFFKDQLRQDLIHSRDAILQQLKKNGVTPESLGASATAPTNGKLADCLTGTQCDTTVLTPFELYTPAGTMAGTRISGTDAVPAFYDLSGSPCSTQQRQADLCPIEVTTFFRAQCKPDLASTLVPPENCDKGIPPEFIEVFYKIRQAPSHSGVQDEHTTAQLRILEGTIIVEI